MNMVIRPAVKTPVVVFFLSGTEEFGMTGEMAGADKRGAPLDMPPGRVIQARKPR